MLLVLLAGDPLKVLLPEDPSGPVLDPVEVLPGAEVVPAVPGAVLPGLTVLWLPPGAEELP